MAVVLRFSGDGLLSCRFAVSPLHETINAVRLLARPDSTGHHLAWLHAVTPVLAGLQLTPLTLLSPARSYAPDFLSPPPDGPATRFADQLAVVRATPAAAVRAEIDRCLAAQFGTEVPSAADPLLGDPASARDLCGDLLESCWSQLVEPWWPRIRTLMEADIAYRARILADAGLAAVLTGLHPQLQWTLNTLRADVTADEDTTVTGDGLVLMPGVFGWPGLGIAYDPPWPPFIDYTARGVATLWADAGLPAQPLARLLGARRASLLTALGEPASTTGLAARCALPTSSVSEHLAVLRDAGLITTRRTGRYLQHSRTELGTALAEGSRAAATPA